MKSIITIYRRLVLKEKPKTVYFYPNQPFIWDVIFKISIWKGYKFTESPEKADLKFDWEDTTFPSHKNTEGYINSNCSSISKITISRVFEKVFGYDLLIDPETYTGRCVKKSDLNAKHDGKIVNCLVHEADNDCVYQRLINNKVEDKLVEDIRIPVINGFIPLVYLKYRPVEMRFSNTNSSVELVEPKTVLTNLEQHKIKEFCNILKVDYCEIDAVRDYPDGTLYIVDINHCPSGPPNHLSKISAFKAIRLMADEVDKQFIK
ncbi:hypothetical protein ACFLYK_01190 [Candidatus Cloacimonadota bacterium]